MYILGMMVVAYPNSTEEDTQSTNQYAILAKKNKTQQAEHVHSRTRQAGHEPEGEHSSCQHSEAVVAHGHDGGDEERLVAKFGHNDDGD